MKWLGKNWKWIAIVVALIALSFAAKKFLPIADWIRSLSSWVKDLGPFGFVAFILIYAAATVLFLPGSVLTIAAGLIFDNLFIAIGAAWTGATIGASLAFLAGRYIARSKVESKTKGSEKFEAIDKAIGDQGWKIVGLLRLSPLIPFSISNYFYGITKVGFWPYVMASAGGMLPGTALYVYLGKAGKAGLGGGSKAHTPLEWTFLGVGLLATIGVTVWVSRIAKDALKKSGATTDEGK